MPLLAGFQANRLGLIEFISLIKTFREVIQNLDPILESISMTIHKMPAFVRFSVYENESFWV